jgi:hypothetical protein
MTGQVSLRPLSLNQQEVGEIKPLNDTDQHTPSRMDRPIVLDPPPGLIAPLGLLRVNLCHYPYLHRFPLLDALRTGEVTRRQAIL